MDDIYVHSIRVFLLLEQWFLVESLLARTVSVVATIGGVGTGSDGFGF